MCACEADFTEIKGVSSTRYECSGLIFLLFSDHQCPPPAPSQVDDAGKRFLRQFRSQARIDPHEHLLALEKQVRSDMVTSDLATVGTARQRGTGRGIYDFCFGWLKGRLCMSEIIDDTRGPTKAAHPDACR